MKPFKPATEGHASLCGAFISDSGYKVVRYGCKWSAYFKPAGWKNFGNSCEKDAAGYSVQYDTRKEAEEAASRHFEKFGSRTCATNSIRIR